MLTVNSYTDQFTKSAKLQLTEFGLTPRISWTLYTKLSRMRAVLIALVAIAASAVASVSNAPPPMQDQGAQIASLADTIKEYTGAISKNRSG